MSERHPRLRLVEPRLIRELPAAERPRERLATRGPAGLGAAELVALVIGSGGPGRSALDVADVALRHHSDIAGLASAADAELATLPGMGPAKAARLAAAFELGRRALADWPSARWTIRQPGDLGDRLVLQMGGLEREELRVAVLDTRNHVLRVVTVYVGNVSSSLVRVAELFRDAIRLNAAGVILVHNHPSGDTTPSPDDLHLTAEAVAAGRLLDVAVLDHLVVGRSGWISLRDRGVGFETRGGPGRPAGQWLLGEAEPDPPPAA